MSSQVFATAPNSCLRLSTSLGNLWVNTGISVGNPQVWWPVDLSFWKTQVSPDLGSQSEGAGTCDRYLSYRCATNFMYIMHDILGSYITNDHLLSQLPSCHCYKITKIFKKLEHFKNRQITFGLKETDHWVSRCLTNQWPIYFGSKGGSLIFEVSGLSIDW